MTVESKAEFARRIGKDRSFVTRAGQKGRLVLNADGQVLVEESVARLEATRGSRFDMSDHWERRRETKAQAPAAGLEHGVERLPLAALNADEIGRRTRLAQMKKEEAEAEKRQRELDELTGALVRRDEIERALANAVAVILGQVENMPDRIAPQVHGIDDMERVRARVKDEMEELCRRVSHEIGRIAADDKEAAA